jgi:hypothetical protein
VQFGSGTIGLSFRLLFFPPAGLTQTTPARTHAARTHARKKKTVGVDDARILSCLSIVTLGVRMCGVKGGGRER